MKSAGSGNILIVDDDNDVLYTARLVLRDLFGKVDTLNRSALIPEYFKSTKYDVVVLDMNFSRGNTSGKEGLEWLGKILHIDPDVCVITTTAYGEINLAVQAMKDGASDFLIKPWNKEQLICAVQRVVALRSEIQGLKKTRNGNTVKSDSGIIRYPQIISRSPVMTKVLETIKAVAPTNANVLILGENGTGKELAAWTLHSESMRKQKEFIHVDLGAIPETLFEAELFGHTRGAFTDAREERTGRFQSASGGTLFLDEIGNLSLPLQSKILTAIQNKEIVRIGSNKQLPVDVRLISATNMPLYEMAESFQFRQDLLYRINTVEITLPPLRERREDIGLISEYYLKHFSEQYCRQGVTLTEATLEKLMEYHWPGNIRELAHALERAVILCKTETLKPDDFAFKAKSFPVTTIDEPSFRVEDYEKKAISAAMSKHNGNLSKAAEEIGIARSTLYRKIARFGMDN
jgi:two-component system response regulator HydG